MIGGLSYALDLTEGEPPGHAVRSCLIGMRAGATSSGSTPTTRSHLFYALLLKDAGCSANSARMAALFGADDHRAKRTSKRVDWSGRFPAFVWALRTVAPRRLARAQRVERLLAIKDEGEVTRALMQARCDRGAEIARLLGFEAPTAEAIRALDEHWDGRGQPRGLRGEEIPLLGRHPVPRPDGRDLPRRRRRRRGAGRSPAGAAAAGSTRALVDALRRRPRRHATSGGRSPSADVVAVGAAPTGC